MAFMIHPKHGATHTHDVAAHEAAGWKVSTYEAWLSSKAPPQAQQEPGDDGALAVATHGDNIKQIARRRGRPPKESRQ